MNNIGVFVIAIFVLLLCNTLASESRVLKKLSESHIFVSTKNLTKYRTLQAQQKQ